MRFGLLLLSSIAGARAADVEIAPDATATGAYTWRPSGPRVRAADVNAKECSVIGAEVTPADGEKVQIWQYEGPEALPEFLDRHYGPGVPFLIKGFARDWPAVKQGLSLVDMRRTIERGWKQNDALKGQECSLDNIWPSKAKGRYRSFDRGAWGLSPECRDSAWSSLDATWPELLGCQPPAFMVPDNNAEGDSSLSRWKRDPRAPSCRESPDMIWHGYKDTRDRQARPRHQDYRTCGSYYQVQLFGKKQWTIQSPLTKTHNNGTAPAIYTFESNAGDLIWFPPQMFHETTILSEESVSVNFQAWENTWFSNTHAATDTPFWRAFAQKCLCSEELFRHYDNCLLPLPL